MFIYVLIVAISGIFIDVCEFDSIQRSAMGEYVVSSSKVLAV